MGERVPRQRDEREAEVHAEQGAEGTLAAVGMVLEASAAEGEVQLLDLPRGRLPPSASDDLRGVDPLDDREVLRDEDGLLYKQTYE